LRLFDLNGKLIESKEYSVAEGTNTTNYTVDPKFTPGLYIVQIGDANKKLIKSEKLVIQ